MSTPKHTQGPWAIHSQGAGFEVESGHGDIVAQAQQVYGDRRHEVRRANAKLIAAAPELLAALEAITDLYDTDEGCRSLPEYKAARAAIAKAKGE